MAEKEGLRPELIPQESSADRAPEKLKAESSGAAEKMPAAERGGNIFSRLYERVKSSEVVQNVVDRVNIWTNSAFSKWYEGDLLERQFRINKSREERDVLQKNIEANREALNKLMELGSGLVGDDVAFKARGEISSLEAKAEAKEIIMKKEAEAAGRAKEKVEAFMEKAEAARGRIAGRLTEKIDAHGKNLETTLTVKESAQRIIGQHRAQIEVCEKKIADAEALSGGVKNAELIAFKERVVEELKKKREMYLGFIARQEAIVERSSEREVSLKEKIEALSEKRSGVIGVRMEAGEPPAAVSEIIKGRFGEFRRENQVSSEGRFSRDAAVFALRTRLSNPKTVEDLRLINSARIVAMGINPDLEMGDDVSELLVDNFGGSDYEGSFQKMADSIRNYHGVAKEGGSLTKESEEAINLALADLGDLVGIITERRTQQAA